MVSFQKSVSPAGTVHAGSALNYTLAITVVGNTLLNGVVTDTLPADVTFTSFDSSPSGTLPNVDPSGMNLTWNLPALAPGSYQLTYTVMVNDFVEGGTLIKNGAQLAYSGGILPSSVTVQVTGAYTVRVAVYNEAGELVKIILTKLYSQPIDDISLKADNVISSLNDPINIYYRGHLIGDWDGTNANGDPAPNGIYHIKVDNVDAMGSVVTTTQQAVVSRSLYKVTALVYNSAGEIVRHLYSYVDDPGKDAVMGVQLSTSVIKPSYGPPASGTPSQLTITLSNGTTMVWDGRSDSGSFVQSGQYFVEIHSVDGTGGEATVTKQVSVQAADNNVGIGDAIVEPNFVDLSKGSGAVTFTTTSGSGLSLKASVYTMAGELVRVVEGADGSGIIAWDVTGLANGLYISVVEIKDINGGFVKRQTLKLLVRH